MRSMIDRCALPSGLHLVHEQMIRLVVKAPLTHDEAGAAVLAQLHHVREVLLLLLAELLVLLDCVDLNLCGSKGNGCLSSELQR